MKPLPVPAGPAGEPRQHSMLPDTPGRRGLNREERDAAVGTRWSGCCGERWISR